MALIPSIEEVLHSSLRREISREATAASPAGHFDVVPSLAQLLDLHAGQPEWFALFDAQLAVRHVSSVQERKFFALMESLESEKSRYRVVYNS